MKQSQTEKIQTWLAGKLAAMCSGERLPTERELADLFGVSKATIARTLNAFEKAGKLHRIVGKGTFAGRPCDTPALIETRKNSAETVRDYLVDLIASGEIKRGELLPSPKFLYRHFQVAPKTVKTAFQMLTNMKIARKVGRNMVVGFESFIPARAKSRDVYLFVGKTEDYEILFGSDYLAPAYKKMERELVQNNAVMHFCETKELSELIRWWKKTKKFPHGILCSRVFQSNFDSMPFAIDRILSDKLFPRPRIMTDAIWADLPMLKRWGESIHRGHITTILARFLIDYLIEKNHKSAFFFFEEAEGLWDQQSASWVIVRLKAETGRAKKNIGMKFFVSPAKRAATFESFYNMKSMGAIIQQRLNKHVPIPVQQFKKDFVFQDIEAKNMLSQGRADIWIFAKARRAVEALEYAKRRGKRIPEDIAILSLEDDPKFYRMGISYLGPDLERIGYIMAHSLLGDMPILHSSKGFIEAFAILYKRTTTR